MLYKIDSNRCINFKCNFLEISFKKLFEKLLEVPHMMFCLETNDTVGDFFIKNNAVNFYLKTSMIHLIRFSFLSKTKKLNLI